MLILKLLFFSIISYFISIFVHELGHLIAALLSGWKFQLLILGPFCIERNKDKGKIVFRLEKIFVYGVV